MDGYSISHTEKPVDQNHLEVLQMSHNSHACESLAEMVDSLEVGGEGHSKAVARWATIIAIELGLPSRIVKVIERAGLLHDVGKVELPRDVLNKPGRLTPNEFELVKQHVTIGARIAKALPSASDAADAIEHHHERWDGSGYPRGKRAHQIPIEGRLIAVAESFASMTRPSPYRQPFTPSQALDRLKWAAHAQLDPEAVAVLIKAVERSIPTRMRNQYLTAPLELLISSETAKLRDAFLGLMQQLIWIVKGLLGEAPAQRLTCKLNEAMRGSGLPVSIEELQVKDETPWMASLEDRAKAYREALWHMSIALSSLFGDAFASRLVQRVADGLSQELREACIQYELHPALMQAA